MKPKANGLSRNAGVETPDSFEYNFTVTLRDGLPCHTEHQRNCEAVTGYQPEDYAVDPGLWIRMVPAEDRSAVWEATQRVLTGRVPTPVTHRLLRKDGSLRWVRNTMIPEHDEKGRLVAYSGRIKDITTWKKAEELHLNVETMHLQGIFDYSPAVIYIKDPNGFYMLVNHRFEALFRLTREQLQGKSDHDLFPKNVADKLQENDRQVIETGEPIEVEEVIPQDDGQRTYFSIKFPMFDGEGTIYGLCGISTDMTKQKLDSERLRNLSDRLLLATRSGKMGVWDWDVTLDRLTWDAQMFKVYGVQSDTFSGAYDAWQHVIHPDDRPRAEAELRAALEGRQDFDTEFRIVWGDGSIRTIKACALVQRDEKASPLRVIGMNWDITQQKRMQEERDRFFNLSAEMLCIAGFDGYFKQLNPAWESALGYRPEELMCRPYTEFIHPADVEATRAVAEELCSGRPLSTFENRYRAKDGTYRWLLWNAVVVHQEKIIYAAARDITTRKEAEAELKKANEDLAGSRNALLSAVAKLETSNEKLKSTQLQLMQAEKLESLGVLAAGVSHEVKNPLQTILLGARCLSQTIPESNKEAHAVIEDIRHAVQRADGIVRDLLEFSASSQFVFKKENLHSVIDQALRLVKFELERARISIEREFSTELPLLRMDRLKLEQVFINVFINSVHAMPNGGVLRVKTSRGRFTPKLLHDLATGTQHWQIGEEAAAVEITDTGTGIPAACIKKVFDPFFTTKSPGKGTGLGLSVAKGIIDIHGGSMTVANRPEGGVSVCVYLKINHEDAP